MAGRRCSICTHPDRAEIDAALVAGTPFRNISTRYEMSPPSVLRHRNSHMAEQLAAAAEQRQAAESEPAPPAESAERSRRHDVAEALDIVAQLQAINGTALRVLADARASGDGRLALLAVDRIQRQLELQARLIGQIDERPQVSIWLSADWIAVEQALLDVLSRHPQVRYEVSERLNMLRLA